MLVLWHNNGCALGVFLFMNNLRFKEFVADIQQIFNYFYCRYPDSHEYLQQAGDRLNEKYHLNDLEPRRHHSVPRRCREEEVEQRLRSSLNDERFVDYTGIESDLGDESPEQILKSISILDKAIGDCERKIIYYSALKGRYLGLLSQNDYNNLNMSRSHKGLLVRLARLVHEYPRLRHCELPLNFFNQNFSVIRSICEKAGDFWRM